jgi:hypothetical protein
MEAVRKWQGLATIGSVLALATAAVALAPGASAAAVVHACGTHTVVIETETEPGKPPSKFKVPIKAITTQGTSCASAYRFLSGLYNEKTGKTPEGFTCKSAKFKVPPGSVPEVCTKPGKKIQFAGEGG